MTIIGIDPGAKGGIATLFSDDPDPIVQPYSDMNLRDRLRTETDDGWDTNNIIVYVEAVHAMKNDGKGKAFAFGRNYGKILGILFCYIPEEQIKFVHPQTWKKEFGLINSKLDKKQKKLISIAKAKELFPDTNLLPTHRCKKESDGMAEALLIAEYGRRHF